MIHTTQEHMQENAQVEAEMRNAELRADEDLEQEHEAEARPEEDWDELEEDEGDELNDDDDDSDLIELVRYRLEHPAGTVEVTLDELLTL